jgi:hypothetical protein
LINGDIRSKILNNKLKNKGGLIGIVSPDGEVVYHENINGKF